MEGIKERAWDHLRVHAELSDLGKAEERIITDLLAECEKLETERVWTCMRHKKEYPTLCPWCKIETLEQEVERLENQSHAHYLSAVQMTTQADYLLDQLHKAEAERIRYREALERIKSLSIPPDKSMAAKLDDIYDIAKEALEGGE